MIEVGDKVASRYSNRYGTVINTWRDLCNFELKAEIIAQDGLSYYFYEDELILIGKKENEQMSKLTGYKQVAAIKQNYGTYYYAIYDDGRKYCPGDKVIVSGAANGIIQTIEKIIDPETAVNRMGNKNITAEVIAYVDTSAYEERVAKRKEVEKLKKKMDQVVKQMEENNKYEMYAEKNPELKEMLNAYKELVE